MPPGGRRPGAGRPKGSKAKRHRVVIDEAMLSGLMPVEWMLAVLRDPEAEQSRRDEMAKQCAPFLHPRLAAVEVGHRPRGGGAVVGDVVQVLAVPRGCRIVDGAVIDGAAVEIEPYSPTPPLELTDQTAVCAPPEPPLEVIEPQPDDPNKIESLSAWRRREDPSDF
jgi:hypothetical protein